MNSYELKKEILSIDWSTYKGPTSYNSEVVADALIALMELDDSSQAHDVGDKLIYAIGNDHAGTYYPVVLGALDIIIGIEKCTQKKASKSCALAILNDLYYFEPDVANYGDCTTSELKAYVREKLRLYSDESIDNTNNRQAD